MFTTHLPQNLSASSLSAFGNTKALADAEFQDVRRRGDHLLRDLAFALHLTRKVKQEILEEQEETLNELATAGV